MLITKTFPDSYPFIGVVWVTDRVFKVNSTIFAYLLGIHSIQGGLFHKQGNFSRHNYQQVLKQNSHDIETNVDISDVDDFLIRLFIDSENRFSRDTEYEFHKDTAQYE